MMIPLPETDRRSTPRGLVCASALVMTDKHTATEHIVYDLSTGGARLCGLPGAQVGDEVRVRLQLPWARVRARGRLLRQGWSSGSPDFAIKFFDVSADAEDAILDAVVDALAQPNSPSLLLVQREGEWPTCFDWLDAVSPICVNAITSLGAVRYLEDHPIEMGILSPARGGVEDYWWSESHPGISWRTIDNAGRLHAAGTTFGLRLV